MYINQRYIDAFNADCILLEIKLPRDIFKSPIATEMAIASLIQGGGVNKWYSKNFSGNLPLYASLEIASLEGVLHFYIRMHKKFKNIVESNFYAQYPGIEIVEADDYTKKIRYHHLSKDVKTWSASYKLFRKWKPVNPVNGKKFSKKGNSEPDGAKDEYEMPADFLPIKTYVDYGLDKDPKEEYKIDPITPLLEFMGSIGKGEYFWYQVIIQDEGVYDGGNKLPKFYVNEQTHDHLSLREMAEAFKKAIRTSGYIKHGDKVMNAYGYEEKRRVPDGVDVDGKPKTKEIDTTYNFPEKERGVAKPVSKKEMELTIEDKDDLEAVNKKMSKPLALTVIRLVYVTKGYFNSGHIQNILSFPKPYKGANGFAPSVSTPYDFAWQDRGGKRSAWRAEEIFEEYVEREGFFPHIPKRPWLDEFEDDMFFPHSMKARKMFRMMFEAIFYPFEHPQPDQVSILNLEEIATLWHLPGQVAGTPTLPRIDSVKGNAPSNLPM
jgi:hypothetical protein